MKIKVLGIGSPFGEDQAGWIAAEHLRYSLSHHPELKDLVEIECCDRPGTLLIPLMQEANRVYLIDAIVTGAALGSLHRLVNTEILDVKSLYSTHHAGIAEALEIGAALNQLPKEIILYGIEIGTIDLTDAISDPVQRSIHQVAVQIECEIMRECSIYHLLTGE